MMPVSNTSEDFENNIHANVKSVLEDRLYWNLEEPESPFSLNKVSNYYDEFFTWRSDNPTKNVLLYFPEVGSDELVFDRNKTDIETIKAFYKVHYDLQKNMFSQLDGMFDFLPKIEGEAGNGGEAQYHEIFEETAGNMGFIALTGHDDQIIAVGYGQFITEGFIEKELKVLTEKAIQRQLLPFVLDQFEERDFRERRRTALNIMLRDLAKIG